MGGIDGCILLLNVLLLLLIQGQHTLDFVQNGTRINYYS